MSGVKKQCMSDYFDVSCHCNNLMIRIRKKCFFETMTSNRLKGLHFLTGFFFSTSHILRPTVFCLKFQKLFLGFLCVRSAMEGR